MPIQEDDFFITAQDRDGNPFAVKVSLAPPQEGDLFITARDRDGNEFAIKVVPMTSEDDIGVIVHDREGNEFAVKFVDNRWVRVTEYFLTQEDLDNGDNPQPLASESKRYNVIFNRNLTATDKFFTQALPTSGPTNGQPYFLRSDNGGLSWLKRGEYGIIIYPSNPAHALGSLWHGTSRGYKIEFSQPGGFGTPHQAEFYTTTDEALSWVLQPALSLGPVAHIYSFGRRQPLHCQMDDDHIAIIFFYFDASVADMQTHLTVTTWRSTDGGSSWIRATVLVNTFLSPWPFVANEFQTGKLFYSAYAVSATECVVHMSDEPYNGEMATLKFNAATGAWSFPGLTRIGGVAVPSADRNVMTPSADLDQTGGGKMWDGQGNVWIWIPGSKDMLTSSDGGVNFTRVSLLTHFPGAGSTGGPFVQGTTVWANADQTPQKVTKSVDGGLTFAPAPADDYGFPVAASQVAESGFSLETAGGQRADNMIAYPEDEIWYYVGNDFAVT